MKYSMTVEAESLEELRKAVSQLNAELNGQIAHQVELVELVEESPSVEERLEEPKKKGRGRPPKAAKEEIEEAPEEKSVISVGALRAEKSVDEVEEVQNPFGAPEPELAKAKLTLLDVRQALEKLNDKHGLKACREVLKPYGVEMMTQLKEEQFGDFIAACEKAL